MVSTLLATFPKYDPTGADMNKWFLCLAFTAFIVTGCSALPKQSFLEETMRLSQQPDLPVKISAKQPATTKVYQALYRKVLADPSIMGAVYDDAASAKQAWSFNYIFNRPWMISYLKTGIRQLSDDERVTLVTLLANRLSAVSNAECNYVKEKPGSIIGLLDPEEANQFSDLIFRMIYDGATMTDPKPAATKIEAYVAVVAMIAKAKDEFSDKELGRILYEVMERKNIAVLDCETFGKLLGLMNKVEPIYREHLFNYFSNL